MPLHSELNHRMNMSDAAITAAAVPHALQKMKIARRMQTARKKCRLKKNDRLQKKNYRMKIIIQTTKKNADVERNTDCEMVIIAVPRGLRAQLRATLKPCDTIQSAVIRDLNLGVSLLYFDSDLVLRNDTIFFSSYKPINK